MRMPNKFRKGKKAGAKPFTTRAAKADALVNAKAKSKSKNKAKKK